MLRSTHEQVRNTIRFYLENKIPFEYTIQNETISVKSNYGSYTSSDFAYTIEEINFIKHVKQYIIKNKLYLKYAGWTCEKIMYFQFGKIIKPGVMIKDCVNIDLSAAYWNTAHKLKLINNALYKKGMQMSKQVKLAAIGSLAKKTRVYGFDGKKQKLLYIKRNELTEILWDVICDHVSKILMEAAQVCGNDFIFFWVDGIYVKKAAIKKVEKCFQKHGYKFKNKKMKSVEVVDRGLFVNLIKPEIKIVNGKERLITRKPFAFRTKKIASQFRGYNSDL